MASGGTLTYKMSIYNNNEQTASTVFIFFVFVSKQKYSEIVVVSLIKVYYNKKIAKYNKT